MSIHINQVLDYLDNHPICQRNDTVPSLLENLCDIYNSHSDGNSCEIYALFRKIRCCMENLPRETRDTLFDAVSELCEKHEVLAFSQGVLVGMLLMTEVNRLP